MRRDDACRCGDEPAAGVPATSRSRSRAAVAARLQDALRGGQPVRVERQRRDWDGDTLCGFVVGVAEQWFVLQTLSDAVHVDGYDLVRVADVTDVVDDRDNGYVERAVAALGRPEVDYRLPDDQSTAAVLRSAGDHSTVIEVHLEREEGEPMLVGRIARLGPRTFDVWFVDPHGRWLGRPVREWYGDVTRVGCGSRYAAALARFGDPPPPA